MSRSRSPRRQHLVHLPHKIQPYLVSGVEDRQFAGAVMKSVMFSDTVQRRKERRCMELLSLKKSWILAAVRVPLQR